MSRQAVVLTVVWTAVLLVAGGLAQEQPASQPSPASQPAATRPAPSSQPAGHFRPPRPPWDQAREEDVLAVLKNRLPMRYERLQELKQRDPERYSFYLERMTDWYKEWRKLPPPMQDEEIAGQLMRVKIWQLADDLRQQPSGESRDRLEKELTDAVTRQYDIEYRLLEHKLKVLEEDLANLRTQLQGRLEHRDVLIKGRIDRLLRATTQPARRDRHGPPGPPPPPERND